ncbi:MAG: UDP-N-acetylglucosamine 1-carboxyvinyltransferase [Trueperaceae bacterium]|nr:MAG: UDP-N-acetylglucosamine 1-carboxyvinyltransferase [Trueperaceae bacterium]
MTNNASNEALTIQGGTPLSGEVTVKRAKNSALYLILASLLTTEPIRLQDVPRLSDVDVILDILRHVGVDVRWHGRDLFLQAKHIHTCSAPYSLVSKMRASFVIMGALLARCGESRVSMPGGCAFGPRPIDRHIRAFKSLGVTISEEGGDFYARRDDLLSGRVVFEAPTVGGTQNVILACAASSREVIIENAALEPEVGDLCTMLSEMGAEITGAGTSVITIRGVEGLKGVTYRPISDRIEAGTFMMATAATRGVVTLRDVDAGIFGQVIDKLRESGVRIEVEEANSLLVDARGELRPIDVEATEYPGFPTDLQAPFSSYLATIPGRSTVRDRVYPDRFTHVAELQRAGVDLKLNDRTLEIFGGDLSPARLHAADIRAGGALVIAALAAPGRSVVTGVKYLDRGYEALGERLRGLGANVHRFGIPRDLATGTYG